MSLRRTRNITLTVLAAIAASACDDPPTNTDDLKHCVDENGVVQEESKCTDVPAQHPDGGPVDPQHPHGGGGHFFWYYGGTSAPVSPGSRVTGGSYSPSPGRAYSPPSISRGGFGSTGAGHASGGGE